MKGIDTNVLVRYLVQDDVKQGKLAAHFVETVCSDENPVFISGIILCELVWVLETAYEYQRRTIATILEKILRTRQFRFFQPEILWQSLRGYRDTGADFADNYIGYLNSANECEYTVTFDKKAARLKHFKEL